MNKQFLCFNENHFPNLPYSDIMLMHNGHEKCLPGKNNGPHICNHYLFHLVIGGHGSLLLDGRRYILDQGKGFLICPGQLYQYSASLNDPWEYIWFGFQGDGVRALMYNSHLIHAHPIYESSRWQVLAGYIQRSIDAVHSGGIAAAVQCQGLLYLSISHLIEETPLFFETRDVTQLTSVKLQYIYSAIEYIRKNIDHHFTTSDVAAMLNLDRSYFSRLFTHLCGTPPSKFITAYRLDVAWHLIRYSDTPISEIAQSVGFSDATYFTYRFHKRYGSTPSQLRSNGNIISFGNP